MGTDVDGHLKSISCVQGTHQVLLQAAVHTVQVFQRTHEVHTIVQMQLPREQLTKQRDQCACV